MMEDFMETGCAFKTVVIYYEERIDRGDNGNHGPLIYTVCTVHVKLSCVNYSCKPRSLKNSNLRTHIT